MDIAPIFKMTRPSVDGLRRKCYRVVLPTVSSQNSRVTTSFSEVFAAAQARRESGDLAGALALFEGCERDFPLQKGLVFLVRAELLAELRQPDRAIETLDAALASGCRYKRSWLQVNAPPPPLSGSCPFDVS